MNDIRPPKPTKPTSPSLPSRPLEPRPQPTPPPKPVEPAAVVPLDHLLEEPHAEPAAAPGLGKPEKNSWKKWLLRGLLGVGILLVLSLLGGYFWYQQQLAPISSDPNATRVAVTIESGSTPGQIRDLLLDKQLIRSKLAFDIHTRLTNTRNRLQAGSYKLSPAESLPAIIDHLISGRVESFDITFYPGGTLRDNRDKPEKSKQDVATILKRAGYTEQEIAAAFAQRYTGTLFSGKPASANLEGYVYGQTYRFQEGASVEEILKRTFDEFQTVIETNNLVERYKKQGLTLYEGITLASIIQREVPSAKDQKQVAQVFLTRYRQGMTLGSDITAYYGADQIGVARAVTVDTPYNTRIHTGLPPGPIASPGLSALLAVAEPAPGDYLYFLSGDDEVTYFARTNAEHEANIRDHCEKKCSIE